MHMNSAIDSDTLTASARAMRLDFAGAPDWLEPRSMKKSAAPSAAKTAKNKIAERYVMKGIIR